MYAGYALSNSKGEATNVGASAWITAFGGRIEPGTTSLLEMAIGFRNLADNTMQQQVGIAASRDYVNMDNPRFSDSVLRLQVEYLTLGHVLTGDGKGGFHGLQKGFVPYPNRRYSPGMPLIPSTIGGIQVENQFWIRLWNGNWWVAWNGNWLGYYPGALFNEIASSAPEALWYGEVYDPRVTPTTWTNTDIGSGHFAAEGNGYSASFRNPSYLDLSMSPQSQWPDNYGYGLLFERNDACYTTSDLLTDQAPLNRLFYLGGPGGDAPNGACPVKK